MTFFVFGIIICFMQPFVKLLSANEQEDEPNQRVKLIFIQVNHHHHHICLQVSYQFRATWLFLWQSSVPVIFCYKTVSLRRFAMKKIVACLQELKHCFIRSGSEVIQSSNQTIQRRVLKNPRISPVSLKPSLNPSSEKAKSSSASGINTHFHGNQGSCI